MQFQVPQFIEVEDKIFGPLTFKQFIYVGGGLGACYILYRVLPLILAAPLIAAVAALAAGLAFFQFNGRPLISALEHAFFFVVRGKLYLWENTRRSKQKTANSKQRVQKTPELYVPKLSESKLHELAWSLDIKERIAAGVADEDERQRVRSRENIVAPIRTAREAFIEARGR